MQCNQPCSRFFNRLLPCCPAAPAVASWAITWCTKKPKELLPLYLRQQCIKAQSSRSFPVLNRPTGSASVRFPIRHRVQHTDSHIFYRLVYTIVTHERTQQDTFSGESDGWHFTSTFCLLHLVFFFYSSSAVFFFWLFFFSLPSSPFFYFCPFFVSCAAHDDVWRHERDPLELGLNKAEEEGLTSRTTQPVRKVKFPFYNW